VREDIPLEIVMIDETERKLLDAALKIFSKKGYTDATTIAIADEAGFNEKTLFRKFKTKKNLYDQVLSLNAEKYKKELYEYLFVDRKFDTPQDFLEHYIKNSAKVNWKNFEYVNLSLQKSKGIIEPVMKDNVDFTSEYFEKNIPHQEIDHKTLGISIHAFIYALNTERFQGSNYINYEETLEKFINNNIQIINTPNMEVK